MTKKRDEYYNKVFHRFKDIDVNVDISHKYILELEKRKAELKDQVESIMNFITILIDENLVKDEGILLLDKIVKAHNIKVGE